MKTEGGGAWRTGRAFRTQLLFSGVSLGRSVSGATDRPSHTASGQHCTGPSCEIGRQMLIAMNLPPAKPRLDWMERASPSSALSSV